MARNSTETSELITYVLQTEVIVSHLAKQIHFDDIFQFRQVCKRWNRALIPRMRREIEVKRFDQSESGSSPTDMAEFVSVVKSSEYIPFGNFHLINFDMNDPIVEKFFELCGPCITTLRVEFAKGDIDISTFRELLLMRAPSIVKLSVQGCNIPEAVTNHPNLFPDYFGFYSKRTRELPKLRSIEFMTKEEPNCHPQFLLDLFTAAVNLKNLAFLKYSEPDSVKILTALRQSENYNQLTSIRLDSINESALRILLEMSMNGMRLKEFSFNSLTQDVTASSMNQFLACHKATFECLHMTEVMGKASLRITLPHMKKLKKLTRFAICPTQILAGPFCYSTLLPSLEELTVLAFADEFSWYEHYSETFNWLPSTSLRRLELPIRLSDPFKLMSLAKMFPEVTILIADSPGNQIIPLLFELWPDLEELHLTLTDRNSYVDSLFTGIPKKECVKINKNKSYGKVDIGRIRIRPSIGHLRSLKKFYLDVLPKDIFEGFFLQSTSCLLTDVTVYFGLANLNNIEHLSIMTSWISKEAADFLCKKLPKNARIRIMNAENQPVILKERFSRY